MEQQDIGTINGEPITQEMLDDYSATFEKEWLPSDLRVASTERGIVLRALHDLNIPAYEIEALERKAKKKKQPFRFFIHEIIKNELFYVND